jgi:lysozyme family protein
MTLDFLRAVTGTLQWEGEGFTDHPADAGGRTKYGITQRFLRECGHGDDADPAKLTLADALELYYGNVWQKNGLWRLTGRGPATIACKVFDQVVLMGPKAIQFLQKALNMAYQAEHGQGAALKIDSILGPFTANRADEIKGYPLVIDGLSHLQAKYHREVVKRNPGQAVFLDGWLRRAEYDPTSLWIN